jgi:acetolactate synthase-1/2/3 large subunit
VFAHDGPSVVEVRIDDRATPIHSFKRRMQEPGDTLRPRPGTVYALRERTVSPELRGRSRVIAVLVHGVLIAEP